MHWEHPRWPLGTTLFCTLVQPLVVYGTPPGALFWSLVRPLVEARCAPRTPWCSPGAPLERTSAPLVRPLVQPPMHLEHPWCPLGTTLFCNLVKTLVHLEHPWWSPRYSALVPGATPVHPWNGPVQAPLRLEQPCSALWRNPQCSPWYSVLVPCATLVVTPVLLLDTGTGTPKPRSSACPDRPSRPGRQSQPSCSPWTSELGL